MILDYFNSAFKLALDNENKIDRRFISEGDLTFCVYSIVIDNVLVYIGRCADLYNRFNTYRNAKYWKNAHISNIIKTDKIESSIKKKREVLLLVGEYDESSYITIEEELIKKYNPDWNMNYSKPYPNNC